jgi:NAD(P)-dependent dehydrogenase (short-subunit alcohol dehydrogenase family)
MAKKKSGVIVNVIGAAGERHSSGYIAGSMGNASLMALSRALGADSHKDGIRVVGINPGAIETDRQVVRWRARAEKELGSADRWRELVTDHPFERLGTVDEIANMVAFLCSPASGYTTGCVITIDGGSSQTK